MARWRIINSARRHSADEYGDANKWRTIHEANKDLISDPDLIYPGQELKIPGA